VHVAEPEENPADQFDQMVADPVVRIQSTERVND
jgi:hypothetical protein